MPIWSPRPHQPLGPLGESLWLSFLHPFQDRKAGVPLIGVSVTVTGLSQGGFYGRLSLGLPVDLESVLSHETFDPLLRRPRNLLPTVRALLIELCDLPRSHGIRIGIQVLKPFSPTPRKGEFRPISGTHQGVYELFQVIVTAATLTVPNVLATTVTIYQSTFVVAGDEPF